MANCLTCIHQEVCKERMEIFNLPNIACQYEAHELVGEWTSNDIGTICSVCGEALPFSDEVEYETHFCPNCGADMREGDEK